MAVNKIKAKRQIDFFLPMLERELIAPLITTLVPSDNFVGAKNDTVSLRVSGAQATARDYDFRGRTGPIVLDDINPTAGLIPIRLNTHIVSATGLELEHLTLDDISFAADVLTPQVTAVADRMETKAVAGFRALSAKRTVPNVTASTDPLKVSLEARRLMDMDKVAPRSGRFFLVGSDIAAAWAASDRLSRYDSTGQTGTPALREAIIGRIGGATVVEHNGLNPSEMYYLHPSCMLMANVAPVVPQGATTGQSGISRRGLAATWIQDYDPMYARDRSVVHSFLGVNDVRDERNADGSWIVETGEFDDEELALLRNPDGSTVTPQPVGTRKNVRIVRFSTSGFGALVS